MLASKGPKESLTTLEPVVGTYAIQNGVLYDYYPIKFGEVKGDFVSLQRCPPILAEGYVTYQKKLYKVTLKDLLRSRVNVGVGPYSVPTTNNVAGAAITAAAAPSSPTPGLQVTAGQPELDPITGVQVTQAADVAWKEQVDSLLYSVDPEAEWEF